MIVDSELRLLLYGILFISVLILVRLTPLGSLRKKIFNRRKKKSNEKILFGRMPRRQRVKSYRTKPGVNKGVAQEQVFRLEINGEILYSGTSLEDYEDALKEHGLEQVFTNHNKYSNTK